MAGKSSDRQEMENLEDQKMKCLVCGKETEETTKELPGGEIVKIKKLTHSNCWAFFVAELKRRGPKWINGRM